MPRKKKSQYTFGDRMDELMYHYMRVRQDMDTRRTRKNGWNEIVTAYMGRLPANWPFLSVVSDPRIRTTVLEKTSRLLNAKLQGRLVPREGGDIVKAKINNAILDFQWDYANEGGSMIEKVALADQTCRLFGAAFGLIYWDTKRNTNELKILDQRDVGFDGAATHVKNARWVQIREFTTWDKLEERGYKVGKFKRMAESGEITAQQRSTSYESIVKANRGLQDRVGEIDDVTNPIVEVITEWTPDSCTIFLPRVAVILEDGPNPYKHGKIPIAQLRYYPLGDDIYGESEVESVLPLQRAINAILCGFIDEMNFSMRPPLKISSTGVRIETIEYGPGAQWIMQNPNMVQEMQFSPQVVQNFNATYPALVAAFNTAMGDSSQGISTAKSAFKEKTATEVISQERQSNNRDQYNQLYLSEFMKDIMMFWLSNNKQYLFDDKSKNYQIFKIIGKQNIQEFMQLKLADKDIPPAALEEIKRTVEQYPNAMNDEMLASLMEDVAVPTNPVILNPKEKNPENYEIHSKLEVNEDSGEANLYVTPEDFVGEYDYIPDVKSMSTSAIDALKSSRQQAIQLALSPQVNQMLMSQGVSMKIKDLLISSLEEAGLKDAEGLFETAQPSPAQPGMPQGMPGQMPNGNPTEPQAPNPAGAVPPQAGAGAPLAGPVRGVQGVSAAKTFGAGAVGVPTA